MTIGFDASRAFIHNKTGTENYSYQLLLNLAKIDSLNKYLVYLRAGVIVDTKIWPNNFKFIVIPNKHLWTQFGLAIRTFIDPIDILFVPGHTLPLVRKPALKTVMTVHDLGAEYLSKLHQLKQRIYLSFITRVQLKSATRLIAVSNATREDLIKKIKINPERVVTIYEAVDTYSFKPVKGDRLVNILSRFGIEKEKYFLFVGTIQPRKNLVRLIQAFAEFLNFNSNLKLVLAGGKGWLSDEIYNLPGKLNISSKVKFLGRVDGEYLPGLYSGALALTFPSLFEGFGLPILEAWACDSPVITSNHPPMKEISGNAAILVDAYNVNSIKEAMKSVLDRDRRNKLVTNGQQRLKQFSWEKTARETLDVLKEAKNG